MPKRKMIKRLKKQRKRPMKLLKKEILTQLKKSSRKFRKLKIKKKRKKN